MVSQTSKTIPFIVLAIVGISLLADVAYDVDLDIEVFIPVLTAMGVGGAAIKIVENASAAKKSLPDNVKNIVKDEIKKVVSSKEPI